MSQDILTSSIWEMIIGWSKKLEEEYWLFLGSRKGED